MATQVQKMTAAEFLALPESNQFRELIHGEEIMSPTPTRKHQRVCGNTYKVIDSKAPNGEIIFAPMDVYLDDENIVEPDIFWIAEGGAATWVKDKYVKGAPDLVVEILSPGSIRRDRKDKFELYEKYGVREYWIIEPEENLLEIWQLQDGRFVRTGIFGPEDNCTSPLLGAIDIKAIFAE